MGRDFVSKSPKSKQICRFVKLYSLAQRANGEAIDIIGPWRQWDGEGNRIGNENGIKWSSNLITIFDMVRNRINI